MKTVVKRLRKEANKHGLGLEEYLLKLNTREHGSKERAFKLLNEVREEFNKSSVRQAAEKTWGAPSLAVKAYASWKEGKRLKSRRELWDYKEVLVGELGD